MVNVVAWLALGVALVATGYAWKLNHELGLARRRLDRYNRALFDATDDIRKLREELSDLAAQLHVEIMQRAGSPAYHPAMTVQQAHLLHPQAQVVLAAYHLGGCDSCAVALDETLADVCARSGTDVQKVVADLNQLIGGGQGRNNGLAQHVKMPNIEVEM